MKSKRQLITIELFLDEPVEHAEMHRRVFDVFQKHINVNCSFTIRGNAMPEATAAAKRSKN